VLTSGAKVVKSTPESDAEKREDKLKKILEHKEPATYHGCIITNASGSMNLYEQNETSLGYDFKGKKIIVEGEKNRRVSPPIIEGLDVDTDGANNTLKTAKITVKCFTLKQLEMFEIFFLKPGMNLLVEYGDNSLNRRSGIKEIKEPNKIPTFDRIQRSGKISDGEHFNRIEDALIDKKDYNKFVETFSDYYRTTTDSLTEYLGKVRRTLGTYDLVAGKVTDFNFEVDENGVYTVTLDISQGNQMTLAIPLNKKTGTNSNNNAPSTAGTPTYQQYLESISVDLNLPELKDTMAPEDKWKNHLFNFGKLNEKQSDTSTSNKPYISFHFIIEILMNYIVDVNGTIDKNSFRFDVPTYYMDKDKKKGNAANIFLNYIKVVEMWQKSGTRREFLFKLLGMLNDNGYGFYTLTYGNINDGSLGEAGTIRDDRGGMFGSAAQKDIYRFKPGTINSNVRAFSFNFELSNLVAGRTVFNAQSALMNAAKGIKAKDGKQYKDEIGKLPLDEKAYKSVDFSMYANADGFYSINQIDYEAINKTWKEITSKPRDEVDPNKEKEENEAQNLSEIIKSKSTKFKKSNGNVTMIYKDDAFLREQMHTTIKPKSTLSPIDINLEIDGLSGLSCGEYFEIDGVPEIYNQTGVFQITNTKHNISPDGWKTTIEAGHRIVKKA